MSIMYNFSYIKCTLGWILFLKGKLPGMHAEASFKGFSFNLWSIPFQDSSRIDSRYSITMNMIFTLQVTILHEHDHHVLDCSWCLWLLQRRKTQTTMKIHDFKTLWKTRRERVFDFMLIIISVQICLVYIYGHFYKEWGTYLDKHNIWKISHSLIGRG